MFNKEMEVKVMQEATQPLEQEVTQKFSYQNREGKYLTFSLAEEEYGIGILKIKNQEFLMSSSVLSSES